MGEKTDMESGPFRAPQPPERRVPSRPEPTPRPAPEPEEEEIIEPVKETPKATSRRSAEPVYEAPAPKKRHRRFIIKRIVGPIVLLLIIIALGVFAWSAWSKAHDNSLTGIDSSKYQAVFFTNGQVYFGKLQAFNTDYMKLTDIFYLQTDAASTSSTNPQSTTNTSNNVQLIKLGNEIHGPEDSMILSKQQVLFYENLKADSKVAQSIDKYGK